MDYTTIAPTAAVVPVREFRQLIAHLERLISVDRSACVDSTEIGRWAELARRVTSRLIATDCKRATADDWKRRERAIDRSTRLVLAAKRF